MASKNVIPSPCTQNVCTGAAWATEVAKMFSLHENLDRCYTADGCARPVTVRARVDVQSTSVLRNLPAFAVRSWTPSNTSPMASLTRCSLEHVLPSGTASPRTRNRVVLVRRAFLTYSFAWTITTRADTRRASTLLRTSKLTRDHGMIITLTTLTPHQWPKSRSKLLHKPSQLIVGRRSRMCTSAWPTCLTVCYIGT